MIGSSSKGKKKENKKTVAILLQNNKVIEGSEHEKSLKKLFSLNPMTMDRFLRHACQQS